MDTDTIPVRIGRSPLVIEIADDPAESSTWRTQNERAKLNLAWLNAQAPTIYSGLRGKCLCVAGQELFVADTATEAVAKANAAHPDDDGYVTHYIPNENLIRIYAN